MHLVCDPGVEGRRGDELAHEAVGGGRGVRHGVHERAVRYTCSKRGCIRDKERQRDRETERQIEMRCIHGVHERAVRNT
jgi:hypothetical protein